MRDLLVHVNGRPYKGHWDTWEDENHGRIVEVTRDAWLIRAPVGDADPLHVAERCLEWSAQESLADRNR